MKETDNSVEYTPKEELKRRIARFQRVLLEKGLDASFILQKADLFYFSGTVQSSILCVPAEGHPVLLTRKSFERAQTESALENIVPLSSYRDLPNLLRDNGITTLDHIGMELDTVPWSLFMSYQKMFVKSEFADISNGVKNLRMIKSPYEVDQLRKAGKISDEVLEKVRGELKEGRTEVEVASELLKIAFERGSHGPGMFRDWNQGAFALPIVLSGESGAVPSFTDGPFGGSGINCIVPVGPSTKKIKTHEPIVIDIGTSYNGYQTDVTRTYSVGEISSFLSDAYDTTLKIEERLKRELVPGKTCSDLYKIAEEMAQSLGYGDNFMGYGKNRVRFVGHGIGIEMNEFPVLAKGFDMPLEEGMTVAIEPKLIFPGLGAVGIENTWLIKKSHPEPLTMTDETLGIL